LPPPEPEDKALDQVRLQEKADEAPEVEPVEENQL